MTTTLRLGYTSDDLDRISAGQEMARRAQARERAEMLDYGASQVCPCGEGASHLISSHDNRSRGEES